MKHQFHDRYEAGQRLAKKLSPSISNPESQVLALSPDGIPVADGLSEAIQSHWDVYFVSRVGIPDHPEAPLGVVTSEEGCVLKTEVVRQMNLHDKEVRSLVEKISNRLQALEASYRDPQKKREFTGKTIILVDEGLSAESLMYEAVRALKKHKPARVIAAVPVALPDKFTTLSAVADEAICLHQPTHFQTIGYWYEHYEPVTPEQAKRFNRQARQPRETGAKAEA